MGFIVAPFAIDSINPLGSPFVIYFVSGMAFIYLDWRHRQETGRAQAGTYITLLFAMAMVTAAFVTSWLTQAPVSLNGGMGFDGLHYGSIFERFKQGHSELPLEFPYHQRLGVPYLATLVPLDPRSAFLLCHAIFWFLTVALFVLTCTRVNIPHHYILLATLWLQSHWISVPRGTASYSFTVDSAAIFFMMALVHFVLRRNYVAIILVVAVGAVFKETILLWCAALAVGAAVPLFRSYKDGRALMDNADSQLLAALAAAAALGFGANYIASNVFAVTTGSGILSTINYWATKRLTDSIEVSRYFAAMANAAGGFLALYIAVKLSRQENTPNDSFNIGRVALACYLIVSFFWLSFVWRGQGVRPDWLPWDPGVGLPLRWKPGSMVTASGLRVDKAGMSRATVGASRGQLSSVSVC